MEVKSPTRTALTRLVPPLAVWALSRILEMPSVKGNVMELDALTYKQRKSAAKSLKRGVRNAKSNRSWVAAGAAAIVVGIGLMANATRKK